MKHRLILIDGISGSGKSTTAQYLNLQLQLNGYKSIWYHEEEDNHPLEYTEADIESMHSMEEALKFKDDFLELAEAFVRDKNDDGQIHIIESYYLQDCVRILFQNNVKETVISEFFFELNRIFEPMDPIVIYFRHDNVFHRIRQIWKARGDDWKDWFISEDSQTPYVLERKLRGEEAALTLWSDYQNLTDRLLEKVDYPIVRLNVNDGWDELYKMIISSLSIDQIKMPDDSDNGLYLGTYEWKTETEKHRCNIFLEDDKIMTNLIWGDRRLIFDGDELLVEAFPYYLEFSNNEENSIQFEIKGKRAGRFFGRTYAKLSNEIL